MEQVMRGDKQSKLVFCECGKLHFTYGPITLHFDKEEFITFADSVGRLGTLAKQVEDGSAHVPSFAPNANVCH